MRRADPGRRRTTCRAPDLATAMLAGRDLRLLRAAGDASRSAAARSGAVEMAEALWFRHHGQRFGCSIGVDRAVRAGGLWAGFGPVARWPRPDLVASPQLGGGDCSGGCCWRRSRDQNRAGWGRACRGFRGPGIVAASMRHRTSCSDMGRNTAGGDGPWRGAGWSSRAGEWFDESSVGRAGAGVSGPGRP
jgi:hypothetical protein